MLIVLRWCWFCGRRHSPSTALATTRPTGAGAPRPRLSPRDTARGETPAPTLSRTRSRARADRLRRMRDHTIAYYHRTSAFELPLSPRKQFSCERFVFSNKFRHRRCEIGQIGRWMATVFETNKRRLQNAAVMPDHN